MPLQPEELAVPILVWMPLSHAAHGAYENVHSVIFVSFLQPINIVNKANSIVIEFRFFIISYF